MFEPVFCMDSERVPVLSRAAIEHIGQKLIEDYKPSALRTPQEIDIDDFVQNYLGMRQDFQYLSHCGVYLGMTVFNDTYRVVVYDPETDRAKYISAQAGTILIDTSLLDGGKEHRYRFTMGHEAGHGICHRSYYEKPRDGAQMNEPMVRCRLDAPAYKRKDPRLWTSEDRMEWQANYLSSVLLMPGPAVRQVARDLEYAPSEIRDAAEILAVAETFNVYEEAAQYRLLDLRLIRSREPVSAILDFAGV